MDVLLEHCSKKHYVKARLHYAAVYQNLGYIFWKHVSSTDEIIIEQFDKNENLYVFRKIQVCLQTQHIVPTVKDGCSFVQYWRCSSAS